MKKQKKQGQLWWEEINDYAEACQDLEWLFYHQGFISSLAHGAEMQIFDFEDNEEKLFGDSGPIAEQIWAVRENLA